MFDNFLYTETDIYLTNITAGADSLFIKINYQIYLFRNMKNLINKLAGLDNDPSISFLEEQKKIVNLLIYLINILGILALLIALLEYVQMGIAGSGSIYPFLALPYIFVLIFRNSLSVKLKTLLIIF